MRMNRFEWLARFFHSHTQPRVKREKRESKPMRQWSYRGVIVKAHTKSEARAQLKSVGGLKRLPAGARIVEVD